MADRVNRQASTSSRHSLRRYPSSSQSSNSDVFSDNHAIESPTVADGEAPRSRPRTPPRMSVRRSMTPRTGDDAQAAVDALKRRSSNQQSGHHLSESRNSFSLRNDAPVTALHRNLSSASRPEMTQRPTSMVSSSFSMPRAQSPFVGASGPSHPYNMYPQDAMSLNRSSTGSTIRQPADRPYAGPNQPVHPYAMYSQATGPEEPQDPVPASRDIATVGFPGLSQGLARRIGPDGEDADDLVGADGYTEQLPPYTRYPEMASKERFAPDGPASATTNSTARPSAEALRDGPAEAQSGGDGNGNGGGNNNNNSGEAENDGEESVGSDPSSQAALTKPKWMASKRRFFKGRIPAWAMCLGVFLIVVIAAAVGGVVGMYLAHKNPPGKQMSDQGSYDSETTTSGYSTTPTTIFDAVSLSVTPTNLPPLPTGDFGFQMMEASDASNECLTDPSQAAAWGCAEEGFMLWNVTATDADDADDAQISLIYGRNDWQLCYGPQPPDMPDPTGLLLMEDTELPDLGPAYFFQSQYTKTVILPADTFNASNSKRSLTESFMAAANSPQLQRRDTPVAPGDQPWVCYWNNTLIEGFIYVMEDELPSSLSSSYPASYAGSMVTPPPTAAPTAAPSTTSGVPASTGTAPAASETYASKKRRRAWGARDSGDGGGDGDDDDDDGYAPDSPPVPSYPRALKMEERRLPNNAVQPYCQQMTVSDELTLSPMCDDNGAVVPTIKLDECEPEAEQRVSLGSKYEGRTYPRGATYAKRDQTACLCQWLI